MEIPKKNVEIPPKNVKIPPKNVKIPQKKCGNSYTNYFPPDGVHTTEATVEVAV